MEERIRKCMDEISTKDHLLPLLKNLNLTVSFDIKKQFISVVFKDGEMIQDDDSMCHPSTQVIIGGEEEAICSLLEGRIKLREGVIQNRLTVSASFHTVLLLESLFFLARPG